MTSISNTDVLTEQGRDFLAVRGLLRSCPIQEVCSRHRLQLGFLAWCPARNTRMSGKDSLDLNLHDSAVLLSWIECVSE